MWHKRSGQPDNVTDEGDVVPPDTGAQIRSDKAALRGAIENVLLQAPGSKAGAEAGNMARLAASYLLAGDVETARRYVVRARELLET